MRTLTLIVLILFSLVFVSSWLTAADAPEAVAVPATVTNTAVVPVPKLENDFYDWYQRHDQVKTLIQQQPADLVFIGDSITHLFGGLPASPNPRGRAAWDRFYGQRKVVNLGFGWDRTQNVLWRLEHGEFAGLQPKIVVLLIGTNNLTGTPNARENTPAEIAEGIAAICKVIHAKAPACKIVLVSVLPRSPAAFLAPIREVNRKIRQLEAFGYVTFLDLWPVFAAANGLPKPELMADTVHPNAQGYQRWAETMEPVLVKLLAETGLDLWPRAALLKPPRTFSADQYPEQQVAGVRALLFESVPYRGKPTKVFAYYSAPSGVAPAGGWPAIVIAHGGGGTAYPDYVKMWNRRGYAAIAMDLAGKLPFYRAPLTSRQDVADGFPSNNTPTTPTEEWQYHAVSQIVLAHSLVRSFPEVNPEATGLVGTSWGGVHACVAAALDPRFKFIVSVYGGGAMPDKNGLPWWDPTHFLPQVKTPFFWIIGPEDGCFPTRNWQKSVSLTPGTAGACLVVKLGHSDGGQAYPVIARMADSVLRGGAGLLQLGKLDLRGREVSVKVAAVKPLVRADLCYTTDRGDYTKRAWQTVPATLVASTVTATLPEHVTAFFLNVYDEPGPVAPAGSAWPTSSEYIEANVE